MYTKQLWAVINKKEAYAVEYYGSFDNYIKVRMFAFPLIWPQYTFSFKEYTDNWTIWYEEKNMEKACNSRERQAILNICREWGILMKVQPEVMETEEETTNVIPFLRPITGGKGPPGTDWLSGLDVGAMFICQSYDPNIFVVHMWEIIGKIDKTIQLFNPEHRILVNPERFCKQFQLLEILGYARQPKEDQSGGLQNDEDVEGKSSGVEE